MQSFEGNTPTTTRKPVSIHTPLNTEQLGPRSSETRAPLPYIPRINGKEQAQHLRMMLGNVKNQDPEHGLRRLAEHAGQATFRRLSEENKFSSGPRPEGAPLVEKPKTHELQQSHPFIDREKLQQGLSKELRDKERNTSAEPLDEMSYLKEQLEMSQLRHHELAMGVIEGITGTRGKNEKKESAEDDPSFLQLVMYLIVLFMQAVAQEDDKQRNPVPTIS